MLIKRKPCPQTQTYTYIYLQIRKPCPEQQIYPYLILYDISVKIVGLYSFQLDQGHQKKTRKNNIWEPHTK